MSAIAPASDFKKISREQYGILFRIADQGRKGKVTWEDFVAFEGLLKKPDAEYDVSVLLVHFGLFTRDLFPSEGDWRIRSKVLIAKHYCIDVPVAS